jgi:hypothetical protein
VLHQDLVRYTRVTRKARHLLYPRNPWTRIHAGREFLYDLRHPLLFGRRVLAGLRGEIPQVGRQQRVLAVAMMAVGGVNVLTGAAVVAHGIGWL